MNKQSLDNRLFCLQQTHLPNDIVELVTKADIAFLQDRDDESLHLVLQAETLCQKRNIAIYKPLWIERI